MHAGPPCSSWVWINRGTSGRSLENVMGDLAQPSVRQGNTNLIPSTHHELNKWLLLLIVDKLIPENQITTNLYMLYGLWNLSLLWHGT